jgi:2-polyprenyl-3-methyl-5-hydroxy-6-metoxy-1,4-benzoquinol methylase
MQPVQPQHHGKITGTPVPREVWERQYRTGGWDYLAGDEEAGHYQAIAELYGHYLHDGSVLDIGCGAGILLAYLQWHAGMEPSRYTGIDLAQEAVNQAAASWPGARFSRLDYATEPAPGRYDGVVFNETLYCFADPLAVLDKSIAENMHADSRLIVSMYGEHHEPIWDAIATRCDTIRGQVVRNSGGVRWKICLLRPRRPAATP